jgi:hypothetical protein
VVSQHQKQDGHHLRDHLDLAERGRGNRHAPCVGQAAEHRDGELAAQDDGHHPGRGHAHLHQRHQRRRNQQLVGERVHELPELRHLPAAAGEVAVQPVRQRRDAEDGGAEDLPRHAEDELGLEARQQHHDEQRNQEDAGQRKRVRQVHGCSTA